MKAFVLLAVIAVVSSTPIFTGDVLNHQMKEKNLVGVAEELGLTTLIELVKMAGLEETLTKDGPYTLFAPNNDAFNALSKELFDELKSNMTALREVLIYHLHVGKVMSSAIKNDLLIQSVLKPFEIRFNTYDMLVTATGSPIVMVDKMASNGVIHVLSKVMYPIPSLDMVKIIEYVGNFSTLYKALEQTTVIDDIREDAVTLFAPTNDAFAKIPEKVLSGLLANKTALTDVLSYHVLPKTVWSAALKDGTMATTLEGKDLTVHINDMGIMINSAKVIMPNGPVTNGVIHTIDTVLMPPTHL